MKPPRFFTVSIHSLSNPYPKENKLTLNDWELVSIMTGLISWLVGTSQGPGDAVIRQNISDLKKLQAYTAIMIYIGCFELHQID